MSIRQEQLDQAIALAKSYGATRLILFGSAAILQFYTLVTKLSKDVPKIPGKCFRVCGVQIFS
jgi:hypothetical protein